MEKAGSPRHRMAYSREGILPSEALRRKKKKKSVFGDTSDCLAKAGTCTTYGKCNLNTFCNEMSITKKTKTKPRLKQDV